MKFADNADWEPSMDINSLSSNPLSPATAGNESPLASQAASKKITDSLSLSKTLNQGALITGLLPSLYSGPGINADLYTAIGMQSSGMLSRGLAGIELANISLGIDTSEKAKAADKAAEEAKADDASGASEASEDAAADKPPVDEAAHAERVLNGLLQSDGVSGSRLFSNPGFSNPGLGGLLNSLG